MKTGQIPSRELYDAYTATGNANYSYEEIVATLTEAHAVNAEYETAVDCAWCRFDEAVNGIDFMFMSDEQRELQGRLTELLDECYGVISIAMKGSKEMVPVRRIQKEIKAAKRNIKRINDFQMNLQSCQQPHA